MQFTFLILSFTYAQKTHVLLVSTVLCDRKCAFNWGAEADILRAYHLLKKRGIPEENIILMTSDDFVNNSKNPWPGKFYGDEKKGVDLHENAKIDYSGKEVTRENIISVLMGDKDRIKKGNGRVIQRYYSFTEMVVKKQTLLF